jgi:hypothetical protein
MSSSRVQVLEALRCCSDRPAAKGRQRGSCSAVWKPSVDWSEFCLVCAPEDNANRGPDMHWAPLRWDDEHMRALAAGRVPRRRC